MARRKTFRELEVGKEFKRQNFASHNDNPGILLFKKISDQPDGNNCEVISEDYNGKQLRLSQDERVFEY